MEKPEESSISSLKRSVEAVFGRCPQSPSDFDRLSSLIYERCRETAATSTLKRIWGYVKSNHVPTFTTLSVLARYAGFRDWNSFLSHLREGGNDSGFTAGSMVVAAEEPLHATFRVEWAGGKSCTLRKIADPCRFEVVEAGNIKLKAGDIVNISSLATGEKFLATGCIRNNVSLGTYTGAIKEGISSISRP